MRGKSWELLVLVKGVGGLKVGRQNQKGVPFQRTFKGKRGKEKPKWADQNFGSL